MRKTVDFLDELAARYDLPSDNRIAQFLGLTRGAISTYRVHKSFFDDDTAVMVADLLNYPPTYVIACCHYERETRIKPENAPARVWRAMAEEMEKKPCCSRVVPPDKLSGFPSDIYYVKSSRHLKKPAISDRYSGLLNGHFARVCTPRAGEAGRSLALPASPPRAGEAGRSLALPASPPCAGEAGRSLALPASPPCARVSSSWGSFLPGLKNNVNSQYTLGAPSWCGILPVFGVRGGYA